MDLQFFYHPQICECATGGATLVRRHWVWTLIIWVTCNVIYSGRHAEYGVAEWNLPRLGYWVQDLPFAFYIALAVPGAIVGFIYGLYAHQPPKIALLVGAIAGSFLIPVSLLLLDQAFALLTLLLLLAFTYWIFCV